MGQWTFIRVAFVPVCKMSFSMYSCYPGPHKDGPTYSVSLLIVINYNPELTKLPVLEDLY